MKKTTGLKACYNMARMKNKATAEETAQALSLYGASIAPMTIRAAGGGPKPAMEETR